MSNKGDGKSWGSSVGGETPGQAPQGASYRGGSRRKEVVVEEPTMRAVAINREPRLLRDPTALSHTPEWMVGPPPKGLGPLSRKSEVNDSKIPKGGLTVKEEWTSCWKVKTEALEMPSFPLERTSREIPGVEADVVSSRISEALRRLSIEAEYDDGKAKAKCRTQDYACFRIRLFAGSDEGQPVIVELQRRSGPGVSFMQSCRAILCAAEGQAPTVPSSKKVPPFMKCSIGNMKCLQGVMPKVDGEAEVRFALDKAMELLRKDQYDSSTLAMENLQLLTDPIKTCPETAIRASKAIVTCDEKYNIRDEMTALLERDGLATDFDHTVVGGQDRADRLRHLALAVFSNALLLTAKDGSLKHFITEEKEWFVEFLVPTLMDQVRCAATSPNNAHVASGCLYSLMSCSSVARGLVREYDGERLIGEAHEHGVLRHELLASETKRCMQALEALE